MADKITDLPGMSEWEKYNGINVGGVHYSPEQVAQDEGLASMVTDKPNPVYKSNTGGYTTDPYKAVSSITLDQATGNIKISAPKALVDTPEFQEMYPTDVLKQYSQAYQMNQDYKVPYTERNENGEEVKTEITIPEFVEKLNESLVGKNGFLDNAVMAEDQRKRYNSQYNSKANNMTLGQVQKTLDYGKYVYIPEFLLDNQLKSLKSKVDENGRISIEDFRKAWYNRDKVGRLEITELLASIDGTLKQSDWGEETYEDDEGNIVTNKASAEQMARALNLKNYIQSVDPDAEWYQQVGDNIGSFIQNAEYGCTRVFANIGNLGEAVVTLGHGHGMQNYINEMDESMQKYNEESTLVNDATATIGWLGQIGGTILGTVGVGMASSAALAAAGKGLSAYAAGKAAAAEAVFNMGPSAQAALTAETMNSILKGAETVSLGARVLLKASSIVQKASYAKGVFDAFKNAHQVTGFAANFLIDTIHDALLYDSVSLRQALEASDQETRDFWLGQLADNGKWWMGMAAVKGTFRGFGAAGKAFTSTNVGSKMNAYTTKYVNKLAANVGDKKAAIKDMVAGGDLIDSLEEKLKEANKKGHSKKARRIANKIEQTKWNDLLRESRRNLGNIKLESESIGKLTDVSLTKYTEAVDAVKSIENAIDTYNRDLFFKRQEMIGVQKDPATGRNIFINPDLGGANVKASDYYFKLADLNAKYGLEAAASSDFLSQATIDYMVGSYHSDILKAFVDANGPNAAKAADALAIVNKNVEAAKVELPDEIIKFIDNNRKVYTDFYAALNDYGKSKGLLDVEKITGYEEHQIWAKNGYMPIKVEKDLLEGRWVSEDGMVHATIEQELRHHKFLETEGQHYIDPEMVRQTRINNMARSENNLSIMKAYSQLESATNVVKISGEETAYAAKVSAGRAALRNAINDAKTSFAESTPFTIRNVKNAKKSPVRGTPEYDQALKEDAMASFSFSDTQNILRDKGLIDENAPYLTSTITEEGFKDWFDSQSDSVKNYIRQQYDKYGFGSQTLGKVITDTKRAELNTLVPGFDVTDTSMMSRQALNDLTGGKLYSESFANGVSWWKLDDGSETKAFIVPIDELERMLSARGAKANSAKVSTILKETNTEGGYAPLSFNLDNGLLDSSFRWYKGYSYGNNEYLGLLEHLKAQGVKDVPITVTVSKGEMSNDIAIAREVATEELTKTIDKVAADGKKRDIDIKTLADAIRGDQHGSMRWLRKLRDVGYGNIEAGRLVDEAREYAKTHQVTTVDDRIKNFMQSSSVKKGSVKDITDDLKKALEEEPDFYIFHSQHKPLGSIEYNAGYVAQDVDKNLGVGDAFWIAPNKSYVTGETPHGVRYGENLTIGKLPKDKLVTAVELKNKVNELAKKFEDLDVKHNYYGKKLTKAEQAEYDKLKNVFVSGLEKEDFRTKAEQTLDDDDYKLIKDMVADNGYQVRGFRPIAEYLGMPMLDTSEYMKRGKGINGSAFFYYKGADSKFDEDYAKQLKTQADANAKAPSQEVALGKFQEKYPSIKSIIDKITEKNPRVKQSIDDFYRTRDEWYNILEADEVDPRVESAAKNRFEDAALSLRRSMHEAMPETYRLFDTNNVFNEVKNYKDFDGLSNLSTRIFKYTPVDDIKGIYRELGGNEIDLGYTAPAKANVDKWNEIAPTADNIPTTDLSDAEIRDRIKTFFKEDLKDVDSTFKSGGLTAKDFNSKENKAFLQKLGIDLDTYKGNGRAKTMYGRTKTLGDNYTRIDIYTHLINSKKEMMSTELHEAAHAAWALAGDDVRIRVGEDLLHKLGVDGKLTARLARSNDMHELITYACEASAAGDDIAKLSRSAQRHLDNMVKAIAPTANKSKHLEWKKKIWSVVNSLATYIKGKIAGLIDARTFDDFYNGLINGDFAQQLSFHSKYAVPEENAGKVIDDAQNWLNENPHVVNLSSEIKRLLDEKGTDDSTRATMISMWMTESNDASTAKWNAYRGFVDTDGDVLPTPVNAAAENAARYKDFLSVIEAGGEDFEAGLQRAYLLGDTDFMNSDIMQQAIKAQEDSKSVFYGNTVNPEATKKLSQIKSINAEEVSDMLTGVIRKDIEDYVNTITENVGARKTIDAMSKTTNGSAMNARYYAIQQLADKPKVAFKSLDEQIDSAIKRQGLTTDEAQKIKDIAHEMFEDIAKNELDSAAGALRTINSALLSEEDIFKQVDEINKEIKGAEDNIKSRKGNIVMYLDNQGRSVYAETDPAFASLFNYRYRLDKGEASALAKANAAMSKLFRYGTTSVNLASFGNQLFRDFGNALFVGGAWHTIKYNADNLVDVFGENIIDQIKRFDPSGYEMRQVERIAEESGMSLKQAAVSRELSRGAAISPSTTERTLYKDFMKNAYKSNDKLIEQARTKLQSVIDKYNPEDLLNGRRENYLRNRVFANSYNEAISNGYTLQQARTFAEFAMNNATTNFSRQLYHMQAIADSTPYFRAGINGTKSFWRMWSLDPVGISGRIMGGLILPTIYLTGMSVADPENREIYKNIPEYQKENSIVFVINGAVMSIPIPQEMSSIVAPFRQFTEYLWDANKNDFWELMMNDALGYSPVDLTGFTTIDMNTMVHDPTLADRINRGFARVFSTMAPVGMKSLYILATKTDPYTGKNINDPSYSYWDDEKGEVVTVDYTQNEFAKWFANSFGGKLGMSSALAEKILGGIFGTTGANVLSDITALCSSGLKGGFEETVTNMGTQLGKPFSVEVYSLADSAWRQSVQQLTAEKNAITSSDEWKTMNSKLSQEKDPEKRNKILSERQNLVNDYQQKVVETVKRLQSEYGGTFDKSKFAATIQLLNFATDPAYQSGSQYSSDIASDAYWDGRNDAIHTMEQLGIVGTNDMSIFGYLAKDKDGNPVVKYSSPVAILDTTNAWKSADDVHSANINAAISTADLWNKKKEVKAQTDAIYAKNKLTDADYDAIDAIYINWNADVMKTIAPYVERMTPEAAINNIKVMDTLKQLIKVPGEYKKDKYGKYVTNTKLGEGSASDAYIENYIKKIFKVNDTGWSGGKNFSGRESLGGK